MSLRSCAHCVLDVQAIICQNNQNSFPLSLCDLIIKFNSLPPDFKTFQTPDLLSVLTTDLLSVSAS